MTSVDALAILPLIVVAATTVVVMLAIALRRDHATAAGLAMVGLVLAFASLFVVPTPRQVTPLLVIDGYSLFFTGLILAATFAVAVLSYGYLEGLGREPEEFYLLLLAGALGSAVLVSSSHFASFFLGLEILSVSLYALIGYARDRENSIEAALKYLILAGASSAFLLFGMGLIYFDLGTMEFGGIAASSVVASGARDPLWLAGMAMLVVGVGFKLAVVPFHMWTPDVYQGSPAPATAFLASVSKGGMFALLLRYFTVVDFQRFGALFVILAIIAIASMLGGNLLALQQTNVKRLLAYSSISHLGYLLVALIAGGAFAPTAVGFYLVAYFVTIVGAFGVVAVLSGEQGEIEEMEEYRGLAWRRPGLAAVFTAMLLSLAGIPLTAGFIGKFYVVVAGVNTAQWLLLLILVASSAIGIFYYLRLAIVLYTRGEGLAVAPASAPSLTAVSGIALGVLTLLLVWLGVYPAPLIQIIQATVGKLG